MFVDTGKLLLKSYLDENHGRSSKYNPRGTLWSSIHTEASLSNLKVWV